MNWDEKVSRSEGNTENGENEGERHAVERKQEGDPDPLQDYLGAVNKEDFTEEEGSTRETKTASSFGVEKSGGNSEKPESQPWSAVSGQRKLTQLRILPIEDEDEVMPTLEPITPLSPHSEAICSSSLGRQDLIPDSDEENKDVFFLKRPSSASKEKRFGEFPNQTRSFNTVVGGNEENGQGGASLEGEPIEACRPQEGHLLQVLDRNEDLNSVLSREKSSQQDTEH